MLSCISFLSWSASVGKRWQQKILDFRVHKEDSWHIIKSPTGAQLQVVNLAPGKLRNRDREQQLC